MTGYVMGLQTSYRKVCLKLLMRVTYSYESILRAVGQVLDDAGVQHMTLRETSDGLMVEGRYYDGADYQQLLTLSDLCSLIDSNEGHIEALFAPQREEAHSLREFLAKHEAVLTH
jgi:hypothetical protein